MVLDMTFHPEMQFSPKIGNLPEINGFHEITISLVKIDGFYDFHTLRKKGCPDH